MIASAAITAQSATQALVLYDGKCAFCRRGVETLKKLDWLKKLSYQDFQQLEHLPATVPPLERDRLLEEMHLVTPSGSQVYAGFYAFRWMAWRLPLTWLIAPFLYVPGIPWLGVKAYVWIAKHRYHLIPCKDGVCELPARKP